jgi:pectate lyase
MTFVFHRCLIAFALLEAATLSAATPNFDLVGFATLNARGQNGTTGGFGGNHVQVTNLADFVRYAQTNTTLQIELLNDIDCSSLANASGGFPTNYPVGEILINSNKTIYSRNGSAIRRGLLCIGSGPNGKHNIIIRNVSFRDLWVLDSTGQYDQYGWDYISIESGSHHVWVDHCDFEKVYDGMLDVKTGSDFVTISWNIFRSQKKCSLVGHSESNTQDRGRLNVTSHHNWYDRVEERIPRMRFGNAHVFNIYCNDLGGKGIQSTTEAATLVENVWFHHPRAGSNPTIEVNGGGTGIVKVVNSRIVNLPGVNVTFREFGASNFTFNAPFAAPKPPYDYSLDPLADVPGVVTNYAGTGKIDFELWQMNYFSPQLSDPAVDGRDADPDMDGASNFHEFMAGTNPTNALSVLRVSGISRLSAPPRHLVTWNTAGGRTNILQAAPSLSHGGFVDISPPIVIAGSGDATTNYAAPEILPRFYRVRLDPETTGN